MPTNFAQLVDVFFRLIQRVLPVLISLAFLFYFWGLVKFISKSGEKDVSEGKSLMIWGLVALFVLVSIWGILRFGYGELGFSDRFGLPFLPPRR